VTNPHFIGLADFQMKSHRTMKRQRFSDKRIVTVWKQAEKTNHAPVARFPIPPQIPSTPLTVSGRFLANSPPYTVRNTVGLGPLQLGTTQIEMKKSPYFPIG
jgi:hypothetical protein